MKRSQLATVAVVLALVSGCAHEPTGVGNTDSASSRQAGTSALSEQANGDHFYASSERFGYVGTVSVYDSWAEAKSGRHARCSRVAWPQSDGAIFVVRNAPEYYADNNIVLTNWFATESPSNKNEGFVQLYDENADTWQNQSAFWSKDLDAFTVRVKGRNATYGALDPEDYARLWNACAPAGSGETTKGTFLTYDYEFVASGLHGVEVSAGFSKNTTNASDYSGHFRGIFRNESVISPASNGYYVFDISFNSISWAAARGLTLDDEFGGRRER